MDGTQASPPGYSGRRSPVAFPARNGTKSKKKLPAAPFAAQPAPDQAALMAAHRRRWELPWGPGGWGAPPPCDVRLITAEGEEFVPYVDPCSLGLRDLLPPRQQEPGSS